MLTPLSKIQDLARQLAALNTQHEEIRQAKFFHIIEGDGPDDRIYDDPTVLMSVPASVLQDALFSVIDAKIKTVVDELAAVLVEE